MPWGFSLPHPANLEAANEDKINSYFKRGLIRKGNLLQEHLVMYSEARYKLHFWIIHYFGLFVLLDPTRVEINKWESNFMIHLGVQIRTTLDRRSPFPECPYVKFCTSVSCTKSQKNLCMYKFWFWCTKCDSRFASSWIRNKEKNFSWNKM